MFDLSAREARVIKLALGSRILVLGLMILSDSLFIDLSSSAHLQAFPCVPDQPACEAGDTECLSKQDPPLGKSTLIDELAPWDSVYFIRVAKCGYEFDQINAFFPLLPLVMRYGQKYSLLYFLEPIIPLESLYTLIGLTVNLIAFCISAVALSRLSLTVLQDPVLADISVLFFCFNPASVFYSAVYTEALFSATSWMGMLVLGEHHWTGVALLTAAGAARSNGILNCWFLIHKFLEGVVKGKKVAVGELVKCVVGCVLILTPYTLMQAQAYFSYCQNPVLDPPVWCFKLIPSIYGYVQDRYWDVGLFRFYTKFIRWPRILQSLPVAYLAVAACWTYFSRDWSRAFTLGLIPRGGGPPFSPANTAGAAGTYTRHSPSVMDRRSPLSPRSALKRHPSALTHQGAFLRREVAPYMYHLALMTAMAICVMHVNVMTRFLSSCPPLYWYTALYWQTGSRWQQRWVWTWAVLFMGIGILMFPNFLPWT